MSACEKCWGEAYARSRMLGGSQVDHYHRLLADRIHGEPTDAEIDAAIAANYRPAKPEGDDHA